MEPRRRFKVASSASAAALLAGTFAFLGASPAVAATTCSGSLVKTITHYTEAGTRRVAARTEIYFDGTYNCAILHKVLSRGEESEMRLSICTTAGCATDRSYSYRYYAGPVRIYGRNRCITIHATSFAADVGYSYFDYRSSPMLCG
jgi:hypothetical protein